MYNFTLAPDTTTAISILASEHYCEKLSSTLIGYVNEDACQDAYLSAVEHQPTKEALPLYLKTTLTRLLFGNNKETRYKKHFIPFSDASIE